METMRDPFPSHALYLVLNVSFALDPTQSGDDNPYVYSTPNSEWDTLTDYTPGEIIDIDVIVTNYHWVSERVLLFPLYLEL